MNCIHECQCDCHNDKDIRHVIVCCLKCELCGKNIIRLMVDEHLQFCHNKKFDKNSFGGRTE